MSKYAARFIIEMAGVSASMEQALSSFLLHRSALWDHI
jgi:hypothetical protein